MVDDEQFIPTTEQVMSAYCLAQGWRIITNPIDLEAEFKRWHIKSRIECVRDVLELIQQDISVGMRNFGSDYISARLHYLRQRLESGEYNS